MCSINGFNWTDEKLIRQMNKVTSHRGPDGTNTYFDDSVSLGHNRLSIIDTRAIANQPMESDDSINVIVFNGEIYNFNDIRKELCGDYNFKTLGDTEVILAAYKKWGYDCLSRFNGMYAFAIWDRLSKTLFLARDSAGIKPLYYYWDNDKFIFSSEIKAILEHPIPRVVDNLAFQAYMRVLYTPGPHTMFKGVSKLLPGHYMVLKNNSLNIYKSNEFVSNDTDRDFKDPLLLKKKIEAAVTRQLVSDRPLGVYLSGGLDSTTILNSVAMTQKNIKTFSVGFELDKEEQFVKFNQDLLLARETAKFYKTDHHEIFVKKDEVVPLLKDAVYFLDEPISNATVIPMLKISRYARNFVTVVLGGDGGDELFGGYERYRLSRISSYYNLLPNFIRGFGNKFEVLRKLNSKKGIEQFKLYMFQKDDVLSRVIKDVRKNSDLVEDYFNNHIIRCFDRYDGPDILMRVDQQSWLVDESLIRSDKMSMAGGVEMRVPLLDLDLESYSRKIPIKCKVGFFKGKKILRYAMRNSIPDYILKAPKRGWFSPGAKWLRDKDVANLVEEVFTEKYYKETCELFDFKELMSLFCDHKNKKGYHYNIIWSVLFFQMWAKKFQVKLK